MTILNRIDRLKAQLDAMRPLNETELKRLRGEFIVENTFDSNAIEGSTLTLRETALILLEGVTIGEKPLKEHLEAIGHRDAFEYALSLASENTPLTEGVIKEIHTLVLMHDARNKGVYRSVPVAIVGAVHTPPQPYLVPVRMYELIKSYEGMRDGHIIEAAAEFHLRFEGIHPFIDGNGRAGRLILNLELLKAGLLPVNIKYSDRRRYYDCFGEYFAGGSPKALIELIADYELNELEKRINILEGR